MKYNDAESVMKDLEESHNTVKVVSQASDKEGARDYSVSVRGPIEPDELERINELAAEFDATVSEHGEHGNVRIS